MDRPVELLVADTQSTDGSPELARSFGATVLPVHAYAHGATRNLLMEHAAGSHVAFLTQDSVPAGRHWLAALLDGFALAGDVGLAYGPQRARSGAPVAVARELDAWFASIAPDGAPRLDRGAPGRPGPAGFFTSTNGMVARAAWRVVPFPDLPYAEDQGIARDMLRAGFAKAFMPGAVVVHSHEYAPLDQFRRAFDEWRGLHEVHGWVQPISAKGTLLTLQSEVRKDLRAARAAGLGPAVLAREAARSVRHWSVRAAGAAAGSRADRLPPAARRWCSLERRA